MQTPIDLAKYYFEISNRSDLKAIAELLTETTTYSSQNTGVYLGRDNIIEMQTAFHGQFSNLHWTVNSVDEVSPGVVLFDFDFLGERPDGSKVETSGLEYVIVYEGKIYHVEIRNKTS
jgi:hypothetical protein